MLGGEKVLLTIPPLQENSKLMETPAENIALNIVYEDEHVIAFHDIAPQAPIHLLIIPREHLSTLNQFDGQQHKVLAGHMMLTAAKLAHEFEVSDEGYRLNLNTNQRGGQTVFHTHLHLLAGRTMKWPPG